MANNRTSPRLLLLCIFRAWHNLPYNSNKATALLALLRPRVLTVQCLQNSTVAVNATLSMARLFLLRKQMAKPGSSFLKKSMQSTGRRICISATPSPNAADAIF
jgi:hypothetical protein